MKNGQLSSAAGPRDSAPTLRRKSLLVREAPAVQALIDAMPGGVALLNAKRQIVAANRALLETLRVELGDVLGLRMGEMVGCPYVVDGPDGCGTSPHCRNCGVLNAIEHCQSSGLAAQGNCDLLVDRPVKGTFLELRVKSSLANIGGEEFVVCALEDVSDRKRLAELSTLFFHDVLNTVGGIQGHLFALAASLPDGNPQEDFRRLGRLADQLVDEIEAQRDLLLAESGDLEVVPQVLRVPPFCNDLCQVYARHAVGEQRRIEPVDVWDGLLVTDLRLLSRVLGNMLRNALEATPPGSAVRLSCAAEEAALLFRVHNPGVIPEAVQSALFRRPVSTKGRGRRGVGIRSIKILAERYLQGQVGFASAADSGTTFWLRLPKALLAAAQPNAYGSGES